MPRRPRIPSASSSSVDSSFNFRNQIQFDATKSLIRSRSDCFLDSKRKQDKERTFRQREESTPWDIKPPDFRLQLYQPKPKIRNARESMILNYDEDKWRREHRERTREKIKFERVPLPKILQHEGPVEEHFVTKFRVPDSYTAKLMFVKDGKFQPGPYRNPGLPVFRADTFTKVSKSWIGTLENTREKPFQSSVNFALMGKPFECPSSCVNIFVFPFSLLAFLSLGIQINNMINLCTF